MFEFLKSLTQNTWVITPNKRLSQHLQKMWADKQADDIVLSVNFLPFSQMVSQLYLCLREQDHRTPHPQALNTFQFQALFGKIIETQHPRLYNPNLVQKLMDTWNQCEEWGLPIEKEAFSSTPQTYLFYQCAENIKTELKRLSAISNAQLSGYLMQHRLKLPFQSLLWYGFDDLTPRQAQWMDWFKQQGITIQSADITAPPAPCRLFKAADAQDEQEQWLTWLKSNPNQDAQLAVVIPDLPDKANALTRLMHRHFLAEEFNISLGRALLDYPLVGHALTCLTLHPQSILSTQQMHLLLHSPFIGGAGEELGGRSALLESKNLMQNRRVKLSRFIALCRKNAPGLAQRLAALNAFPKQASPYQWAEYFDERLALLGFPGNAPLRSDAYQTYQRFCKALNEFRSLNLIEAPCGHERAIGQLRQVLQHIIFQPQASPKARIHLYGLLEAEGIPFDGLWITGLHDAVLPQAVHYSPFIPIPLQQRYQMPHASMERELKLGRIILDRFHRASPEFICSFPASSDDRPNLVSPLINQAIDYPRQNPVTKKPAPLETWEENYQIPLTPEAPLRGGSAVLSNQSKCPFKAFARHRLHCEALVAQQEPIEHREQGILIHRVMEWIWQTLQSQDKLKTLRESEKQQLIDTSCSSVLEEFAKKNYSTDTDFSLPIEHQRLSRLAAACLALDAQRPPFSVIGLEAEKHYRIGSHTLKLKIDRLDRDAEGKQWVIDYKSRVPSPPPWREERPEEPQLLLYALLDKDIHTLAYLHLKATNVAYRGVSAGLAPIKGISPLKQQTWEQGRSQWEQAITHLKNEFEEGICPPAPLKKKTCLECEYNGLCRFNMQQMEEECSTSS